MESFANMRCLRDAVTMITCFSSRVHSMGVWVWGSASKLTLDSLAALMTSRMYWTGSALGAILVTSPLLIRTSITRDHVTTSLKITLKCGINVYQVSNSWYVLCNVYFESLSALAILLDQVRLRQKYYTPQVRHNRGLNSWPSIMMVHVMSLKYCSNDLAFCSIIFLDQVWQDTSTTHPKFDPTGVRTYDLQIMTVHFMSMRRLL